MVVWLCSIDFSLRMWYNINKLCKLNTIFGNGERRKSMIKSKLSKEFLTGIVLSAPESSRNMSVLMFFLERDGSILRSKEKLVPKNVREYTYGCYSVASDDACDYYLMDAHVAGNSIFFVTKKVGKKLFGTYIQVEKGKVSVKYNYQMVDPRMKDCSLCGENVVYRQQDGTSMFVNTDILMAA